MAITLKPLSQQVIVITGASSGIGLSTARRAAERGAKVVLASRHEVELARIVRDLQDRGKIAMFVVADVSRPADVERIADQAERVFGRIDTWVNDAGLSVYGRFDMVPTADVRTLFDINYWGLVYGSVTAAKRMRRTGGGCIVNLGSVGSEIGLPLQSHYTASKHAIKGFTETMRMELMEEGAPIAVSLIRPAAINTNFADHARNYTTSTPTLPPPVYRPEDVADAILHAAEHGERDYTIGGGGMMLTMLNQVLPWLVDRLGAHGMGKMSTTDRLPRRDPKGSLDEPGIDGTERGRSAWPVMPALATQARLNPVISTMMLAGAGLAAALAYTANRKG